MLVLMLKLSMADDFDGAGFWCGRMATVTLLHAATAEAEEERLEMMMMMMMMMVMAMAMAKVMIVMVMIVMIVMVVMAMAIVRVCNLSSSSRCLMMSTAMAKGRYTALLP